VYEDLDGVEAEENYIVEGYIVDVDVSVDPEAIATIWRYIEKRSKGLRDPGVKCTKLLVHVMKHLQKANTSTGLENGWPK